MKKNLLLYLIFCTAFIISLYAAIRSQSDNTVRRAVYWGFEKICENDSFRQVLNIDDDTFAEVFGGIEESKLI